MGVILDSRLTSLKTINVIKKITKKVSLLGKVRRLVSAESWKTLHNAIIVQILFIVVVFYFRILTVF